MDLEQLQEEVYEVNECTELSDSTVSAILSDIVRSHLLINHRDKITSYRFKSEYKNRQYNCAIENLNTDYRWNIWSHNIPNLLNELTEYLEPNLYESNN